MKLFFCALLRTFIPVLLIAQAKDALGERPNGNSFKQILAESNPGLRYSFNRATYTHDYSGNWDFDGDKKMDSLYFIGDNTLHWFHLRIILSSDKKARDYRWILSDFPVLQSLEDLQKSVNGAPTFRSFVVDDFNHEGKMSMYIHLNIRINPIPALYKRKGVSTSDLLIEYTNKHLVIRNFPMNTLLKLR